MACTAAVLNAPVPAPPLAALVRGHLAHHARSAAAALPGPPVPELDTRRGTSIRRARLTLRRLARGNRGRARRGCGGAAAGPVPWLC